VIDRRGFRLGVGIIIVNDINRVFLARRIRQNAWQFPQGGIKVNETSEEAMFREMKEEVGLDPCDVDILAHSKEWLYYRLPRRMVRYNSRPVCIGQKQKWYLLRMKGSEDHFKFDITDTPEFDGFRWVNYWFPLRRVIPFKKGVYRKALTEFSPIIFNKDQSIESIVEGN